MTLKLRSSLGEQDFRPLRRHPVCTGKDVNTVRWGRLSARLQRADLAQQRDACGLLGPFAADSGADAYSRVRWAQLVGLFSLRREG
jgi:hypothetical protein